MARRAGVSTKTLYRLVPNKAALFEGMVSDRLDRFLSDFSLHVAQDADIETGLNAALLAVADLALDPEVVALQRIILQETGQFSDLAATFYNNGIVRTAAALSSWLRVQGKHGRIDLDNAEEAAGILIGMVVPAPQRAAIFGGVKLLPSPRADQGARGEMRNVVSARAARQTRGSMIWPPPRADCLSGVIFGGVGKFGEPRDQPYFNAGFLEHLAGDRKILVPVRVRPVGRVGDEFLQA